MLAWITQQFLVPVSTVSTRNAWHNSLLFVTQKRTKNSGGGTSRKIGTLFQTKICDFPYPISDLIKNLIPYFRPETMDPAAYIKREMVSSPNDEEVANSFKKHTQFKTRRHKPYPVSYQNGRNWYPISNQNGWKKTFWRGTYLYSLHKGLPPGRKTRCRLRVSLVTQARLTTHRSNAKIQPTFYSLRECSYGNMNMPVKHYETKNRPWKTNG